LGRRSRGSISADEETEVMARSDFLKIIGLGVLGLSSVAGTRAFAAAEKGSNIKIISTVTTRSFASRQR
jgi:hypothetical protein